MFYLGLLGFKLFSINLFYIWAKIPFRINLKKVWASPILGLEGLVAFWVIKFLGVGPKVNIF